MAERLRSMAEATSAETGTAPGSVNPEVSSPKSAESTKTQQGSTLGVYSPDFDPNRTDYQAKEVGHFYVYVDPKTGKEVARIPKVAGGAIDIPDWAEQLGASRPYEFQQAIGNYETLLRINPTAITDSAQRAEFEQLLRDSETEIRDLVTEADRVGILTDVRKRALNFYKQIKATKRYEKWGRDKQQVIDQARQGYGEAFWNNSPQLKQLEVRFRGVARYVWDGIVAEADKEVNHEESPPLNVVAAAEFNTIKEQRRIDRLLEKKYATHEYYGSRNWELTAENAEELIPSAIDWVRDQIAEISDTDVSTINRQIETIRETGVRILETCRVRLEAEEGQDVSETNPYFLRAKALIEAVTDVLGNERVIKKGGEEIGPQYKERFASNYIAHHDAIYLENPKAAYIMHKITTHRDGTYWLGQPLDSEKYSEGEIEDYRRQIEEEIVEDAATHDLFAETIFAANKDLFPELIRERGDEERSFFELRDKYNLKYSLDDPLERMLLDPNNEIRNRIVATGDQQALQRHDLRVEVFRRTKERLDQKHRLAGLTPYDREQKIRLRIFQKMKEKTKSSYLMYLSQSALSELANARASNDLDAYDRIMWNWVKEYNDYRIKYRLPRWAPSGWDRVKQRIDRSTKVLDRSLSKEEFEAMFEPISLSHSYDPRDINMRRNVDDARFGFQLAKSYQVFTMQDALLGGMRTRLVDIRTGQYTGRLPDDEVSLLLGLIRERRDAAGNVVTDPQTGRVVYDVVNPNQKIIRIFDIVQARLEDAIAKEAAEIDQAKAAKAQAIQSGDPAAIKATTEALRDLLVNSQFLATHALKEIGLVEGKLPVWSYNFLDEATLDVFMKALADYGVEEAPGIPISHNNKKTFYEIMERGRRALKAENDRASREHMQGTYPVFARNPDGTIMQDAQGRWVRARSLWRASDDFGDVGDMSERYRMINKGGVAEDRRIVDARYETSTSGGVAVTELIPPLGDLGFYPELVWLAVEDNRGLHGYIHRRDEDEFHYQRFLDVMDPVQHARAQGAAYAARRSLVGGKLEGISPTGRTPGLLKEPFHAAFKSADWLHNFLEKAKDYGLVNTHTYIAIIQQGYRKAGLPYSRFATEWTGKIKTINAEGSSVDYNVKVGDIEKYRQLSYLDFDLLGKPQSDDLYTTMYGVFDYFQWYLQAVKDVESNRRGRAPRNWEYNNTLRWYEVRRAMRESVARGEKGFIIRLGYSPEVASEIAIRMVETVLLDADYLILRDYERARLALDGAEILSKALDDQERQNGFEYQIGGETRKTFGIPDERYWSSLRPDIRRALETIRRRGLLDFMREEGYGIYNVDVDPVSGVKKLRVNAQDKVIPIKQVLGQKMPPLVRALKVQQDQSHLLKDAA